jgi:UDP-N-acetylmuramyl pentapeptide synthase
MKQYFLEWIYSFLALCARHYIKRTEIKVIGITGSVGKTSCRMVVSQVLQQIPSSYKFYTSPKNYNSELGLVFSVFKIEDYSPSIKNLLFLSLRILKISLFDTKNYDILIAEYGIDSPKDMEKLLQIAVPDIAVLTKLDSVHSVNYPN